MAPRCNHQNHNECGAECVFMIHELSLELHKRSLDEFAITLPGAKVKSAQKVPRGPAQKSSVLRYLSGLLLGAGVVKRCKLKLKMSRTGVPSTCECAASEQVTP